jgi:hypothetical protein
LERAQVISESQSHRWRPLLIALHAIARVQPQGPMRAMEVVIEELQVHQCIEGGILFGESVRLAGKGIEPITESSVESFEMHRSRSSRCLTVCVKLSVWGTTKRGRPRLPVRIGWR